MKRRGFITKFVAAGCGYSLLTSCTTDLVEPAGSPKLNDVFASARKGGGNNIPQRNPLKIPPTVSPQGFTLQSKPSVSDLGGGQISNVLSYNDNFPGPTVKVYKGDNVSIELQNFLDAETITHWHGMIVDHPNDGHPAQVIPPGGTYNYNFPVVQRATLNWYHPHPHMHTGEQVYYGQAGAFVIADDEEAALGLPSGKYEVPLIIRDATLDRTGNLNYKPRSGGFLGQIPLVNGTRDPYLSVDRTMYRFRVLNGSNSRIYGLALSDNSAFTLIGNDGGLLPQSSNETLIDISNGERLDLLVDFSNYPAGSSVMLVDTRSGWKLLEFRVTATQLDYQGARKTSSIIEPLSNPVTIREFSFDGMSKINGQEYEMERIDFQVPLGQTELWRFTTSGNAPHPVHVHGAYYQVVSRTGGRNRTYPWETGWKDTVLLEDRETVEVLIRFNDYKGIYLLHCHKLEHEDMGMMSNFEVV